MDIENFDLNLNLNIENHIQLFIEVEEYERKIEKNPTYIDFSEYAFCLNNINTYPPYKGQYLYNSMIYDKNNSIT